MWTSRTKPGLLALCLALCAAAGCGAESGDCVRYSDCSLGLTCAFGKCVPPPPPSSDADGATVPIPSSPDADVGDDGGGDAPLYGEDAGDAAGE